MTGTAMGAIMGATSTVMAPMDKQGAHGEKTIKKGRAIRGRQSSWAPSTSIGAIVGDEGAHVAPMGG
jgi:hypothetical protein